MRLKKNVFGYINFSIGTLIMSVYLYTLFVSLLRTFEEKAGKRILVMGIKLSNILGVVLLLAAIMLIWLLFFIKGKIAVKPFKASGLVYTIVYWFIFAALLGYGFYVRLTNLGVLRKWGTLQKYTESVSNPGYWKKLLDLFYGDPVSFDNFFHKAYSYVAALFLRIFGDSLTVPVALNFFLYMASAVLLFFSIRFLFGKVPALVSFGALMLLKAPVSFLFEITGFNMFLFALSLLVFLVAYFLDVFTNTMPVMCYIVSGITVIVAIVLNHFTFKKFEPVFSFDLSVLKFRPADNLYLSIVIAFFALIAYFAFLKNKEDEISFANILLVVLMLILMFDYSSNNTYLFAIMSFCILAGFGIDNFLFRHYKSVTADENALASEPVIPEEILSPVDPMDIPVSDMIPEEVSASLEEEPESPGVITVSSLMGAPAIEKEPEADSEPAVESAPKPAVEASPEPASEPVPEPEVKKEIPRQFETPLPMPKKPVRKSMGFAVELTPDLMKYDIEIDPDDDFDLK